MTHARSPKATLRGKLLIGASLGALLVSGVADAREGRISSGRGAAADPAAAAARAAQEQAARQNQTNSSTQRALEAFRRAAQTRAQMNDAQVQARLIAQSALNNVPNGLGRGGLEAASDITIDPSLWQGAKNPVQANGQGGRTNVTVEQTDQKAILTWDSFNVGRETDLTFAQGGADWVVLNRVRDASPSQIHGSVNAKGTVLILNQNGILFGGASSINVRNLVASSANITNDAFLNRGIYSQATVTNFFPSFTGAGGAITVAAGAQIKTHAPTSATQGGGYVLLMGTSVSNAGSIITAKGQTLLSAGDDFLIRRGYGTVENKESTTRGNEVRGLINAGSTSGTVTNSGLIEAAQGDITLGGRTIRQDGVLVSTTGVNQRGTIHLLNSATDAQGSVTLGKDSLTAILPELDSKETALNSQRDALIKESETANNNRFRTTIGGFDDRSMLADRLDQSRIEIVTGGNVTFEGGSQTRAQGGQVAVQANAGRITVGDGALIDVSGVKGIALDMESNSIMVNVQGNEMRDSPGNRENDKLRSTNVWLDVRDLTLLPSGTGGYEGDRWYTGGGLLEVGGYIGNMAHGIGEWAAVGGTITLAANEVVAHKGATLDISGGSLDYRAGWVRSTRVLGADGKLYDIGQAPAWMEMIAWGDASVRKHDRWGSQYTQVWSHPLSAGRSSGRWEDGYSVGRDAGRLILSAPTVVMEAQVAAEVLNGERQINPRAGGITDGYKVGQHSVARAGSLLLGRYDLAPDNNSPFAVDVRIGDVSDITGDLATGDALPGDRTGTAWFDAARLNEAGLGGLTLATSGTIAVERDLKLADGGAVEMVAPNIDIAADITARSGTISATNIFKNPSRSNVPSIALLDADGRSRITVREGTTLDVRGLWANAGLDFADTGKLSRIDGGKVYLASTHDVFLEAGSLIDVSSGAAILPSGKIKGGRGGDITLAANFYSERTIPSSGALRLDGALAGYGVEGGGKLSLSGSPMLISDGAPEAGRLLLRPDLFRKGFSAYEIRGSLNIDVDSSVKVAPGTVVDVEMPVYRLTAAANDLPTGPDANPFELWTPPLYAEDRLAGSFSQRKGASLSFVDVGNTTIGTGSLIEVDPGQSIRIDAAGGSRIRVDPGQPVTTLVGAQVTIDGRLNAWGGSISINNAGAAGRTAEVVPGRSIWIGENAVLDVAGRVVTGLDLEGRRFAHVVDGGTINIGADTLKPNERQILDSITSAVVVVRQGAVLDASAASASIDLAAGANPLARSDIRTVAGSGGAITVASSTALVLDGEMRAAAGGAGAAGGTLNLILETNNYAPEQARAPRVFTITQARQPSSTPTDLEPGEYHPGLNHARARFSAEQVESGGFDNLTLWSADIISFEGDVSLHLDQSLTLQRAVISVAETTPNARIALSAPVVRLDGSVGRQQTGPLTGLYTGLANVARRQWLPAATTNAATLTVEADLIDIANWVAFGASDRYDFAFVPGTGDSEAISRAIEAPGFSDISLVSRGDIRFRGGSLATAGNLTLTAAQLYPVTGTTSTVLAGAMANAGGVKPRPDSILAIRSNGQKAQAPASLFGALGFIAGTIDQDGVVRAPLGAIHLGSNVGGAGFAEFRSGGNVILREGSITSVSAAGLVIPYGGTVDGLKYNYNGRELTFNDLLKLDAMGKVQIDADKLDAEAGSVLDLSGGGELAGAGFVAGRGGSVDILRTPLINANPGFGFSASGNKVYAILPGFAADYAPVVQEKGAGDPAIGQQITIPAGIPGLAAGTYTLLPSTYAMLPGAYRVEIGGGLPRDIGVTAIGNGSYTAGAYLGTANTAFRAALPDQILVTPGKVLRSHSQYNETSYSNFALEQAARFGTTRARLPIDGKQLVLNFEEAGDVLDFKGTALFAPGKDGYAGSLLVQSFKPVEIKAAGAPVTDGMVSLDAADLSRFDTGTLFIGGSYRSAGGGTVILDSNIFTSPADSVITVRSGAVLEAAQILLAGNDVTVEDGAVLDTTRSTLAVPDSSLGYVYSNSINPESVRFNSVLVVANGLFNFLPAVAPLDGRSSNLTVADGAILRTRGTIGFVAADQLSLGQAQINARYLALSLPAVNIGTEASLAAADAAGVLGTGWNLTQTTLDRLLNPATTNLAALERLSFSARDGINFYGNVSLDARNHAGGGAQTTVILNTPAIYGLGDAGTSAVLAADTIVWNGISTGTGTAEDPYVSLPAPSVRPGGAGTGSGRLTFDAREIYFGYDTLARSQNSAELQRLALGFSDVNLIASSKVTANNRGIVSVYQSGTDAASYAGGNLSITTPLFTADNGAMIDIRAGGAIRIGATGQAADPAVQKNLGGEIRLNGRTIALDTTVALPSGRLLMKAEGDITLGDRALLDLAGRSVSFFDVTKYSWGGSAELESRTGSIVQAAGSVIDVSARNNDAGSIKASAINGTATFAGTLRGAASGGHDSGGFSLSANRIADFAALNAKLNTSGFFDERSFTTKTGDLVVGNEVKARVIDISVDGGSLFINGKLDASGDKVGTIRLSARDDLTLTSGAVLDVHGTVLQADAHGAAIDASNRGSIELTTRSGAVSLAEGATIDMRSADGIARGRLEINAPRIGDDGIAIDAANRVNILGTASIAVNGFRDYSPSDGVIDQAYLDGIHADSSAFIDAANANDALQAQLAGLKAYGSAFHLRPGVEIVSEGDLVTRGDLDLSGYRYGPAVDPAVLGSGESGVLVVRAGGNLKINGSINDGFAPPPPTQDDYNWEDGREGKLWAVSEMLAPGSQSWSMRLVSGADLAASDTRSLQSLDALGEGGDLVLDDRHRAGDFFLEALSVVRTGTGYLDLLAGGDYRHASLFGVYTAGTAVAQNPNGFWITDGGGDVRIEAGGTVSGYSYISDIDANQRQINQWLRGQDGAWGINFGSYLLDSYGINELSGFAGIGTLGGGNVRLIAGGDAGVLSPQTQAVDPNSGTYETKSSALVVAIGGSGYRDAEGALRQTGGGDLTMEIGGRLNMAPLFRRNYPGGGMIVNVRGDVSVTASAVGLVTGTNYGLPLEYRDPRPIDPMRPYSYSPDSGMMLALGDSRATINTRGDLVLLHVTDPGAIDIPSKDGALPSIGANAFPMWTDRTSIDLFSAGGSVAPITSNDQNGPTQYYYSGSGTSPYPHALSAVAAGGNILVFGQAELAPLSNARLDLLARDSIYYGDFQAGGVGFGGNYLTIWGYDGDNGAAAGPMRFYAVNGDIANIRTGQIRASVGDVAGTFYVGGSPVWIRAGRDIIAGGGLDDTISTPTVDESGRGGLIVHSRSDDVSIIEAGRDIIYSHFSIAGPGTLEVTAGRDIYQSNNGSFVSIGAVEPGDTRPGASIALMAGMANGVDWAAIRTRYLDPANLADPGRPLADQDGKVAKVYGKELGTWLKERYGFAGTEAQALAMFDGLGPEQQRVFLRQVYYAELREGGREYNDTSSGRFGSYLRGRAMIATLFPDKGADGKEIERPGDIIMFGGSGVRTNFGGDIEMMAPGGQIVVGVQGEVPPPSAGVLTQGQGDIRLFSEQSLLLGLSRIMTTFGGSILGWSEEGDINAGRGAKTTVLFTPPLRTYDNYGNVRLAPQVPSSGAGIATLNPIAEVAPGDIDLIAPLGTIDAGEAGIRVSGNINLAALQVLNAANIQVQGEATGIPVAVSVNTGALTSASSAASAVANQAAQLAERSRPQVRTEIPTILNVRFLGFGE
jgi:filamentous hemagglutinin family protein